ncbi:MAG: hypothetical protein HYV27_12160 [Candidatus Hydrogenedentes bacterium]|nr:hypothetical protein [Candidatus Hydrogenedentota bacterium]
MKRLVGLLAGVHCLLSAPVFAFTLVPPEYTPVALTLEVPGVGTARMPCASWRTGQSITAAGVDDSASITSAVLVEGSVLELDIQGEAVVQLPMFHNTANEFYRHEIGEEDEGFGHFHKASKLSNYNGNDLEDTGGNYTLEYNGFSNALTASVGSLRVGQRRSTLAMGAMAENSETVMLVQAQSFSNQSSPVIPLPEPATFTLLSMSLAAMAIREVRNRV